MHRQAFHVAPVEEVVLPMAVEMPLLAAATCAITMWHQRKHHNSTTNTHTNWLSLTPLYLFGPSIH